MNWIEISVHTTQEAIDPVSFVLQEAGASGVVIEDSADLEREWEEAEDEWFMLSEDNYPDEGTLVKAYLPMTSYVTDTVEEVKQSINELLLYDIDLGRNQVVLKEIAEEDWAEAWKKYYKPVQITNKVTIVPSWEEYEKKSSEKIITLDPGMAFGTGTHPTTVLSMQALEEYVRPGHAVLDVGTGSGVLAIGASLFEAGEILALDLDEVAVRSAKENISRNGMAEKITVAQSDLLEYQSMQADIIVANILAPIIIRLAEDAFNSLQPDGVFITSGIIESKRTDVEQALTEAGFVIEDVRAVEDWLCIIARRPQTL